MYTHTNKSLENVYKTMWPKEKRKVVEWCGVSCTLIKWTTAEGKPHYGLHHVWDSENKKYLTLYKWYSEYGMFLHMGYPKWDIATREILKEVLGGNRRNYRLGGVPNE
ncbi:MAG: hypothetical protein FWG30_12085 [Eubacteriaceae bacterium]|nr:hypothetical protein [Eubacteriaceae bacterium]